MISTSTHIMFQGQAQLAIAFYQDVFDDFLLTNIQHYDNDNDQVMTAYVDFAGQKLVIIDSPTPHDFDFTPSMSLFVDFDDPAALDRAFAALSGDGNVMMPLDNYGFSKRFGWCKDRFGLSWQLNHP